MKGAVLDLADFSKDRLFEDIADGAPLIVENAGNMEAVAHCLCLAKEYRPRILLKDWKWDNLTTVSSENGTSVRITIRTYTYDV